MYKLFFALALVVTATMATPAHAQTIVDIAVSDDNFSSLVDAVVSQDLVDTLNSDGPFTVFAPTNDAFAALPGFVGAALADEPELLTDILLYHVVAGDFRAADVLQNDVLESVLGEHINVNLRSGAPYVNSSAITATDIVASNGVVHVIDEVLVPSTVYEAVLTSLRADLVALLTTLRDVRAAQVEAAR